MRIANADKLKEHFEHVVMVKLFTVPEITTIIDTFSSEVPEGKWLPHNENSLDKDTCSNCGDFFYQLAETGAKWNYCPNCGAHMVGGTQP